MYMIQITTNDGKIFLILRIKELRNNIYNIILSSPINIKYLGRAFTKHLHKRNHSNN